MTRRERLKWKLEKRLEWADKANVRSEQRFNTAHKIGENIPFGQPILVGHHSERHARRDAERIHSNMSKGVEESKLANHHSSCAAGIEHALDRSIFSDDDNAIEALEQRIAENEAKREQWKKINALYRKGDAAGLAALGLNLESLREKLKDAYSWCKQPHPAYELQNLGGRITADRKRLGFIKQQAQRKAVAEAAPNGVTLETFSNGYVRVTFAEKPDREILNALRAGNFSWGAGSWVGEAKALPTEVSALVASA